ncbi:MAG: phage terminase large subunit [Desulfarculaceae bacterium]|nr:phage terminase large subunit [Desulfarculaceae bacterium]
MSALAARKMTSARFRQRAAQVVGRLAAEAGAFGPGDPARSERRARAAEDPLYFCATYLPHYFNCAFAPFHRELIGLLEQRGSAVVPVAVAAPRGFAKTTLVSFGYVLHQVLFGRRRFVVLGSDTADLANDLTNYLRLELELNPRLEEDFGPARRPEGPAGDFVVGGRTRILARGSGQRLRGVKHGRFRPDLVILDDLENDKNVKNPRLVRACLEWVSAAVYPAIDPTGSLFIIGTILARRSALATLVGSPEEPWKRYTRRVYRALDDAGRSLWEERHPAKELLQQKRLMGTRAFNTEKQNNPLDDNGMFQEEWLRSYHPAELGGKELAVAGFLDPSLATGERGDFKAVITVGLDRAAQVFYVLDAFIRRCSLDQLVRAVLRRQQRHQYLVFGVEDNLFQRLLLDEFSRAACEAGVVLPLKGVTQRLSKELRLAGLSPLVERGLVRFRPEHSDQGELIEQLLNFPTPKVHDDGPDALEGAVSLLRSTGPNVW